MSSKVNLPRSLIILMVMLAACQSVATPETVVETLVVTEVVVEDPVEVIQVVTPTPEPAGPRTLVICTQEPDGFYPFSGNASRIGTIIEAIFEGGMGAIDSNSYANQPIIHEKLPSLADGDASLAAVTVTEGDTVVDAEGKIVILDPDADPPIKFIPAGGGEPVTYQGGEFELDQLTATFTMLPDLLWSDGTPMTAYDSVYAFNLLNDPENDIDEFTTDRTESYVAIDDRTTVWTGFPGYLDEGYATNFFGPAPEHLWGKMSTAELIESEEYTLRPVGWGPFVLGEWVESESITMHRNPNYFRAGEGLPRMDSIVFRFIPGGSNAEIAALLAGECDLITSDLYDQRELLIELQTTGQLKASFVTTSFWEQVTFGIQPPEYDDGFQLGVDRPDFFSDVRTRQAFAMCMDRQALVDTILLGHGLVRHSYMAPQHPLYNPEVRKYEFDVPAGSALLEEVGWVDDDGDPDTPRVAQGVVNVPDGALLEVALETTTASIRQQVTSLLKESLAQCGIKANVQQYTGSEWFSGGPEGKVFGRNFDLGEFAWGFNWCGFGLTSLAPGPIDETWISIQDGIVRTFINDWDGFNVGGFADIRYDAACNTALSKLPGQVNYEAAHHEAQRIFSELLPAVPLFSRMRVAASRPDICGFIIDPTARSELWNIEEFDYGEGCED